MDLASFLKAAAKIGAAGLQHSPEIISLVESGIAALQPHDQATAKAALADIQADNDAGYARLDAKLAAAEQRPG